MCSVFTFVQYINVNDSYSVKRVLDKYANSINPYLPHLTEPCSGKRGHNECKNIDPCQPARIAQADMSRYLFAVFRFFAYHKTDVLQG